ncbi:hypothetical protein IPU70_10785 [Achromobacter sp. SD115]|uniref:hypothetical protein n=1 Tax=Achromobacter sp. SD115 TaxID=2782011 RepID=UPI001A96D6B9|nr:hypothetical protein [Achromobacter sp. SD115]MBO1014035.1 hypothetical protein [Achromobacter sp. SD115]
MKDETPNLSALTKEKSLFALYRLSWRFPQRKFNCAVAAVIALAVAGYCAMSEVSTDILVTTVRKAGEVGLSLSTSLLGFLIAGFTIFATITKIDLFVRMAKEEYKVKTRNGELKGTGESWLKYSLSAFMVVFVHYVSFLFACILIALFGQAYGPLPFAFSLFLQMFPPDAIDLARRAVVSLCLVAFSTWLVYLVLLLKSFVFNTYQVLVITVRWESQEDSHDDSNGPSAGV